MAEQDVAQGISESDVLDINVGGEVITEKRSTFLLAPEGSLLHSMFSGRWEASLDRDSQGRIFLSFTPQLFQRILSFLRCVRMAPPGRIVRLPAVAQGDKQEFRLMVDYLGLTDFIYGSAFNCPSLKLRSVQGNVRGSQEDRVAEHQSWGHTAVIGADALPNEDVMWKVTVLSIDSYVFLGIIGNDAPHADSYKDATSCGWYYSPQVIIRGEHRPDHSGWDGWRMGDVAIFWLRPAAGILRMRCKRMNEFCEISGLPTVAEWRIHINFHARGSRVELAQAELADVALFAP